MEFISGQDHLIPRVTATVCFGQQSVTMFHCQYTALMMIICVPLGAMSSIDGHETGGGKDCKDKIEINEPWPNKSPEPTAVGAVQFRYRGSRRESAVAQLLSLGSKTTLSIQQPAPTSIMRNRNFAFLICPWHRPHWRYQRHHHAFGQRRRSTGTDSEWFGEDCAQAA